MSRITVLATHLPIWGTPAARLAGPDEDALTLAVAAGRPCLDATAPSVDEVVLVTRDLPGLEGGSEAVLLTGLGLPRDTRCSIRLGGAPAALAAACQAAPDTLVIAVDVTPFAAAAALRTSPPGVEEATELAEVSRSEGSLPVTVRTTAGGVFDYDDPRLLRERGTAAAIDRIAPTGAPLAAAGLPAKQAAALTGSRSAALPSTGAASALFAIADAIAGAVSGSIVAVEQASAIAADLSLGITAIQRTEPPARKRPTTKPGAPATIGISLSAYDRAFQSKVGLQAGRCRQCGTLALPPRHRCLECGSEDSHELMPLPRDARVYSAVSIHVPVPGLATPYDLAIVEIGDSGVRLLAPVTAAEPGTVKIDDAGRLVLRRHAVRAGVADYGYSFEPDHRDDRADTDLAGAQR